MMSVCVLRRGVFAFYVFVIFNLRICKHAKPKMEVCARRYSSFCRIWKFITPISGCKSFEKRYSTEVEASQNASSETEQKAEAPRSWGTVVKEIPGKPFIPLNYRFLYPEFLPDLDPTKRHPVREIIERQDMLKRRKIIEIPEFYVGSVLAVTASDKFAPGKINRFVGICIQRIGYGLRAKFVLRNVVDHQGLEIAYDLYNPTLRLIEVLKLERRLDGELFYLRDALPEYSTVPFDMEPVFHIEGSPIPINPIKVKLKPRPWYAKWEQKDLQGIQDISHEVGFKRRKKMILSAKPWLKYDLMKEYRSTIPEEEQQEIYQEVQVQEKQMKDVYKKAKKKQVRRVEPENNLFKYK